MVRPKIVDHRSSSKKIQQGPKTLQPQPPVLPSPSASTKGGHSRVESDCDIVPDFDNPMAHIDFISETIDDLLTLTNHLKDDSVKSALIAKVKTLQKHMIYNFGKQQVLHEKVTFLEKELPNKVSTLAATSVPPPLSYAEVLQGAASTSSSTRALIIKSTDHKLRVPEIRNALSTIENKDLSITECKPTRSGDLLIKCQDEEDLVKLKTRLESNEHIQKSLQVLDKGPRKTRIIIFNVPSTLTDTDVTDKLVQDLQLFHLMSPSLELVKKIPGKNETNQFVIDCDGHSANKLMDKGKVLLSFSSCNIKRYVSLIRCFQCQNLGHHAGACPERGPPICGTCADHHHSRDCPNRNSPAKFRCANCTRANSKGEDHDVAHTAYNAYCPTYREALNSLRSKLDK